MTALDDLPLVNSFIGLDLKTGSFVIAAIGIVHPLTYGCSFFMPISYLLVTVWILLALYFAASCLLFFGVFYSDALLIAIYIWYSLIFVVLMVMLMTLLALVFTSRKQKSRVLIVIMGMIWYIMTIYFIVVANSHRRTLTDDNSTIINETQLVGDGFLMQDESKIVLRN
ncbi:uncharacterized protein LOC113239703 [Hyposmocoma kahamanoa]|uniref:uncharacterized protein LOC113239703 n=1 Tax=Hyposmocoma kahamanoa TaxID=1477025 RepID=UPI000E6D7048|nr:uncharacterized protein LOC113239703 [Hyposmocoma kahamanoa]